MNKLKSLLAVPFVRHVLQTVMIIALVRTGVLTPDEARAVNAVTAQVHAGA